MSIVERAEVVSDFEKATESIDNGPVIILSDGEPALVLLSYDSYRELLNVQGNRAARADAHSGGEAIPGLSLAEALAMPLGSDEAIDYDFSQTRSSLANLFDHPAFDNTPDDFEFPKLELRLKPADFS